jgi:hypothetical protein
LYYIPNQVEESLPIEWTLGINAIYDDNTTPTAAGPDDETFSVNPFVESTFISASPQTTWDVSAKLGILYYFDEPSAAGTDDTYSQSRVTANLTHQFSERLSFSTRNLVAHEIEPDFSLGIATSRQSEEYLLATTDNSITYQITPRLANVTGINISWLEIDDNSSSNRFTLTGYDELRYVLTPQTVGTVKYRYSQTSADGAASDSTDQFFTIGANHNLTPTTIIVAEGGVQFRDVDSANGDNSTNPYLSLTLRSRMNEQLTIGGFVRYAAEANDTVRPVAGVSSEFDSRLTLRVGLTADYQVSQRLSFFSGLDVINSSFEEGRTTAGGASVGDQDELLVNANIGASLQFTDYLSGSISYNFTDSNSDFANSEYERNRVSLGLRAEF